MKIKMKILQILLQNLNKKDLKQMKNYIDYLLRK
jgi:hypothetical protein